MPRDRVEVAARRAPSRRRADGFPLPACLSRARGLERRPRGPPRGSGATSPAVTLRAPPRGEAARRQRPLALPRPGSPPPPARGEDSSRSEQVGASQSGPGPATGPTLPAPPAVPPPGRGGKTPPLAPLAGRRWRSAATPGEGPAARRCVWRSAPAERFVVRRPSSGAAHHLLPASEVVCCRLRHSIWANSPTGELAGRREERRRRPSRTGNAIALPSRGG